MATSLQNIVVSEIMTTDPITVHELTSLKDVQALLKQHQIHHLPVVDNDNRLIGIVSSSDLSLIMDWRMKFSLDKSEEINDKLLLSLDAGAICTRALFTVSPDNEIGFCYELFKSQNIRALPVVDDHHKLLGIVTPLDLIEAVLEVTSI